MGFFNGVVSGNDEVAQDVQSLEKALTAGYGTDSAAFTGGRALIPENLEQEVINALAENKNDCKIMNMLKKTPVKSTIHEVNTRTDQGDWKHLSVTEGGSSIETSQGINRQTFPMAYLQTRRSITKQMEAVDTVEGALASEKIAGVETIIKAAEYQCFHGNSNVVGTEFNGFEAQIRNARLEDQNIKSLRGKSIGTYGAKIFDEIAESIYHKGGEAEKVFYPPILARDIRATLFDEKGYYNMGAGFNTVNNFNGKALPDYSTAIGSTLALSGEDAGADKFFQVKGKVVADGDVLKRPPAPTSVTASASASVDKSEFETGDAGDYKYTVHAVNQYGISEGTAIASPVTVAAKGAVTLTITPAAGVKATGFIICRSKKDGDEVMEMTQIANSGNATTTFVDKNSELPGTASMLLLPKLKQSYYTFGQLLPVCTFPLQPADKAEIPFLVLMYGALEVRTPKFLGLVKDIGYAGGLY